MKQTIKNIASLLLFVAIVVAAVFCLPVKAFLVIIILFQVLILLAVGGTNFNITNISKSDDSHEQEQREQKKTL